jgi:hypothetical protein
MQLPPKNVKEMQNQTVDGQEGEVEVEVEVGVVEDRKNPSLQIRSFNTGLPVIFLVSFSLDLSSFSHGIPIVLSPIQSPPYIPRSIIINDPNDSDATRIHVSQPLCDIPIRVQESLSFVLYFLINRELVSHHNIFLTYNIFPPTLFPLS